MTSGVTYGPAFLLVTPILIHHVGLEDLSVAFGVIMLSCGIGYIIAPPLGGQAEWCSLSLHGHSNCQSLFDLKISSRNDC